MATGTQNIKLMALTAFIKRNVYKVEQMNDSDNVALLIWYHYCDVRVNSNTTDTTIRAGHIFPSGAHGYAPAFWVGFVLINFSLLFKVLYTILCHFSFGQCIVRPSSI